MNYSIPWNLLGEGDQDFFQDMDIELGPSFLKFNRELDRPEIASVCRRIWDFRSTLENPEENHINFALGDALHQFQLRFGESDGEAFAEDFCRILRLRDHLLKITGCALIYLQSVEHQTKAAARC
jgi:hypothetical protein